MQIVKHPTYIPNERQIEFHQSKAKYRAYIGGIRSGKTYAGAYELLRHVITYPNTAALVVSPTYPMMRDSTLPTFLSICPIDLIARRRDGALDYNKENHNIRMYNGSVIRFRSADDPDKVRGMEVTAFWFDESGQQGDDGMWKIGIGRMSGKTAPCRAWTTTTPNGMNWLYDFFITSKRKDAEIFYASTHDNRSNLPKGYIESLENQYDNTFYQQELLGQFVGYEGLVYPTFDHSVHIRDCKDPNIDETIVRVDAGQDFGFSDAAVSLVVGTDKWGRKYVYDEIYETKAPIEDLRPKLASMFQKYNVIDVRCDPSRPDSIVSLNKSSPRRWNAIKGINDITLGISTVSSYLKTWPDGRPGMIISPRCTNLIKEFALYRYPSKSVSGARSEYPVDKNNHCLDALRYAVTTIEDKSDRTGRFRYIIRSGRNW